MRKWLKEKKEKTALRLVFLCLISLLPTQSADSANAAGTIAYSNIYTGCVVSFSNSYVHAHRYVPSTSTTITAINVLIGGGSQTNFLNSTYYIMSDAGATNIPSSLLATFTADTITGSGTMTTARFIGSFTTTTGAKFWIVPGQISSTFPQCYNNAMSAATYSHTVIDIDSSTGVNTFYRSYTSTLPTTSGWTSAGADANTFQLSIEIGSTSVDTISVAIDAGGNAATYRAITRLRADVLADGKVTFYEGKKIIPGCKNILSTSTRAYCNWRPAVHGGVTLSAIVNPTSSSYLRGISRGLPVGVDKRSNSR